MFNFQPKTYNEALRFSRCTEVRKYAPEITDDIIMEMYNFISANPANSIGLSSGTLYYVNATGEKTEAHSLNTIDSFDKLVLSAHMFRVINKSSGSGCGGCGGCSSNNNNNNNNNG